MKTSLRIPVLALAAAFFAAGGLLSCVYDYDDDCGVWLEFIYDHNMEYADSFDPQVAAVDVYMFDSEGKYISKRHATRRELTGGNRMLLIDELPAGACRVLTVGNLTGSFIFSDGADSGPVPGVTSIEDMTLALKHGPCTFSDEIPPVWFGSAVTVENTNDLSVHRVRLVKNTNNFNLTLVNTDNTEPTAWMPYSFEIRTPEEAVYSWTNAPAARQELTYTPYYHGPGTEPDQITAERISTCRLFYDDGYNYRLVVRYTPTGEVVWDYDLMTLLANTKPSKRPDGTALPMQEYLDRQSEWNLIVLCKGEAGGSYGFTALAVNVNGWILWLKDIDV